MQIDPFLAAIKQHMQPPGRALHQAGMLQHLLEYLPDEVQLSDLAVGWQIVARSPPEPELLSITHRRDVCTELAAIAAHFIDEPGNLMRTVTAWQVWHQTCQQSSNPRMAVMEQTFARELGELQSAIV